VGGLGSLADSYKLYRAELRAYFAQGLRRRPAAAEDLLQVMYERLLRNPPSAPVRDPEGYLFACARNVLREAQREDHRERERYLSCQNQELELFAQGLSRLWVQEEGGQAMAEEEFNRILNQLPRACRVALLRHRRDARTYAEIAAELGVSTAMVKVYLSKALNHFRMAFSTTVVR
jgi:RNA polymerase sigma-70 factor (ECF subfamily)